MNLLTDNSAPPCSVSLRGQRGDSVIVALATPVEFMRFCEICDAEQIFVAAWQCEAGLLGCCLGCGEERLVRFSRVNGEAQ
ncbi:MAG TPA: hypothetical protein VN950_26605 [Terriglobales bacterium]|nr:hypothetical protein [Terriglobales bacterium]